MGTRSLIAVQLDGEYKIAQYSQWDGYPEGQGVTCLNFLREKMIEQKFKDQLRKLKMIQTEEQMYAIRDLYENGTYFPEFDRDTGGEILNIVQKGETTSGCVVNNIGFVICFDCFGCEWAWIIDLDKQTFEAYEGYSTHPLKEGDRFFQYDRKSEKYHPVRMVASWSLRNLPTKEEFLKTFDKEDDCDASI